MALTDAQPVPGTAEYAAWVERQNQDLINYRRAYEAEMRLQGVTVTWSTQESVSGPFTLIDPGNATLTRDGVSVDVLVSRGRAQTTDPASLAKFDIEYALKFSARVDDLYGGPVGVPSPWFGPQPPPPLGPNTTPGPETRITPAQPPTVTTPTTNQPVQTPPTPNPGTVVNPPADDYRTKLLNWDQWNYYWKEETGRPGPDPLQYGIDRTKLISYREYLTKIDDIYNAGDITIPPMNPPVLTTPPIPPPPGSGPTNPPPPSTDKPKKDDMTGLLVIGGIVVLLLLVS